jgi:RimJ/RimL family protein N-acetyltransferase
MAWELTDSLDEFARVAASHLQADPVRQTVTLSVLASLQHAGPARFGASPPVFGWHRAADGTVDGTVLQTPPFPLLLADVPTGSTPDLLTVLAAGRRLPAAVNLAAADETAFLADWAAATGGTGTPGTRSRLYRLGGLMPPEAVAGASRIASEADYDLLVRWHEEFQREAEGALREDVRRGIDDRLSYDGLLLWQADGEPVAMAGLTRIVAGVARITGVYTPQDHRRKGYGGAITTAASQEALTRGASEVVLFTDLANPTSNALYQRLGFGPVEDRVFLELAADVTRNRPDSSE